MGSRDYFTRHDEAERKNAAPDLRHAANTPLAVYEEAAGRFAEIYGSSSVQAQRWFVMGMVSLLLAIVAVSTLAFVFPLKEVRPWVVEVNPATGVVNKPVEVLKVDPNLAVVKSELARWVEAMYTIDPQRTRELQRWATERTADKALGQASEFRSRERVYERLSREPDLVREAKVTAVDASQRGTAFVFVTTTERVGAAPPSDEQTKKFRVTLNYRLMPPKEEAKLIANPLGLYVTFFSDVLEAAK